MAPSSRRYSSTTFAAFAGNLLPASVMLISSAALSVPAAAYSHWLALRSRHTTVDGPDDSQSENLEYKYNGSDIDIGITYYNSVRTQLW